MLLMSVVAFAQNQVTGHVADAIGEPIIGANVTVKGTTVGTITDIDGNFTLEVVPPTVLLWFLLLVISQLRLQLRGNHLLM